ncbi:hypothetical protein NDU88_008110 [Pleurodeles waltl]|uniref:Uncharacterized protein n=1 Tax=Pleurodeles waltl TaxID=8319 RepID=A0AAV7SUQ4_PLEWA|nr:hypothetical protein NDU88_008110 [Pleurodeles waltl]
MRSSSRSSPGPSTVLSRQRVSWSSGSSLVSPAVSTGHRQSPVKSRPGVHGGQLGWFQYQGPKSYPDALHLLLMYHQYLCPGALHLLLMYHQYLCPGALRLLHM